MSPEKGNKSNTEGPQPQGQRNRALKEIKQEPHSKAAGTGLL